MRLKSFRAQTVAEAMQLVRDHFGDSAVIVSTQRGPEGEGVRVTAAVEDSEYEPDLGDQVAPVDAIDAIDAISQSLEFHRVPSLLTDQLLGIASNLLSEDPASALAVALDATIRFEPLPVGRADPGGDRPILLVGPPGGGKTVTTAKLAVRGHFARQPVSVVTTDTVRAGGVEQLEAFTRLLDVGLQTADRPEELYNAVRNCHLDDLVLVDTVAVNPFNDGELADLSAFTRECGGEPVLVLPAGLDPVEAEEIGNAFRKIGCGRMVVTRVDVTRRLGAVLSTAHTAKLKLCDMTNSGAVTQGLIRMNPLALACMLLPDIPKRAAPPDPVVDPPDGLERDADTPKDPQE